MNDTAAPIPTPIDHFEPAHLPPPEGLFFSKSASSRPRRVSRAEAGRVLVVLGSGGAAGLMLNRGGLASVGGTIAAVTFACGLRAMSHVPLLGRAALACSAIAAFGLAVTVSPWLVPLLALTVIGGLAVAAASAAGRPLGRGFRATTSSLASTGLEGLTGAVDIADAVSVAASGRRSVFSNAMLRGLVIAFPIAGIVALLLASGDAVFASLLPSITDLVIPWPSVWAIAGGVLLMGGLRAASRRRGAVSSASDTGASADADADAGVGASEPVVNSSTGSRVEATTVLVLLACTLGLAAVAQVSAAIGGDAYVRARTGLTYQEYARSGFFQLLAASAVTLAAIFGTRRIVRAAGRRSAAMICAQMICVLSILLVAGSVRRIVLYVDFSGWTMLRLTSASFGCWLGIVFVLASASLLVRTDRDWIVGAVVLTALAGLFGVTALQPESFVVRSHVARAERLQTEFPTEYLTRDLSSDATVALVDAVARLGEQGKQLEEVLCQRERARPQGLSWNWSGERAALALRRLCAGAPSA